MRRRYFIPEVIQSSAMDCGPAAIKALFGGYGAKLSYGRLREACQTDVDGTSIDTLEVIATQLGMPATQSMLPPDFLLLESSACLPAIVVVNVAGGAHMVVLWRIHGPWVQVMDPAAGRLWLPRQRFLDSLYVHEHTVPADAWAEWCRSDDFSAALEERMRALKIAASRWSDPAHQDAALRLAGALHAAGQLARGAEAQRFLSMCETQPDQIPPEYWSARGQSHEPAQVRLRGAVLLRAAAPDLAGAAGPLPASLARVRDEREPPVLAAAWQVLRQGGLALPTCVGIALLAAAAATVLEALLFRGLFDLARHLPSIAPRLGAMLALLLFVGAVLALEWPATVALGRMGRHLELRLRTVFLSKVPRLDDRYFQSRLISDMAFRAHWLQLLRQLPDTAGQLLKLCASLLITGLAIALVYPGSAGLAALSVLAACLIPAGFLPSMTERDLRLREVSGSLGSFFLDALLGARALQAHGGAGNMRALQAVQLRRWADAGLRQQVLVVAADATQMLLTYGCVIAMVMREASAGHGPAGLLLLVYWALSIPALGQDFGAVARTLPALRNTLLRFLEPINARVEESPERPIPLGKRGVKIDFTAVCVVVAGRTVLEDVTLTVQPGEHVGIVGVSGAGKSSLLGCLLGWYRPASGSIRVDDAELDAAGMGSLRLACAWIDPQVHLFDASLFDNLEYGNEAATGASIEGVVEDAQLQHMLSRAADGLQMPLGEGGAQVSGGEGQRIRAARALRRGQVRLAVLDEPARGLGREQRRRLVLGARQRFSQATLLCVTHDIVDTLDFDRVIVIEQGRIIEQGPPQALRVQPASRYAQLLAEESAVEHELWDHSAWRRMRLQSGVLSESAARPVRLERQRA